MNPTSPAADALQRPHRRRNPLTGRWVLVSPHRAQRPWQGQHEAPDLAPQPAHDPQCPLCPGNLRSSGERNPDYQGPYVFANDHAALLPAPAPAGDTQDPLFAWQGAQGCCRVICHSHDHGRTLGRLGLAALGDLVDTWCEQTAELGRSHAWVQVFENKGAMMGCSQPHPHGQVWASTHLPDEAVTEDQHQRDHHARQGRPLLLDVAEREAAGRPHARCWQTAALAGARALLGRLALRDCCCCRVLPSSGCRS
jgi:UDPglucose--hexose-1-phosphate uridylyltransferase